MLHNSENNMDLLNIIHLLLQNKADFRKGNTHEWSPVEEAIFTVII